VESLDSFRVSMLADADAAPDRTVQLVVDPSKVSADLQASLNFLRKGSVMTCTGVPACDRDNVLSLYVDSAVLVRCSPEPDAIRSLLIAITNGAPQYSQQAQMSLFNCSAEEIAVLMSLAACPDDPVFKHRVGQLSREMVHIR
jgi:hypothetical protein